MKGAEVFTGFNPNYGTISNIQTAGSYEFLKVLSVVGNTVTFTTRYVHLYNPAGAVQIVRIPVYTKARIVNPLIPRSWNGVLGGIVAIEVTDTLWIVGDINATAAGFRGGRVSISIDGCDGSNWSSNYNLGKAGEKGEGVVVVPTLQPIAGYGALANGGGGGNGTNSGGGGGSNGGSGGLGGKPVKSCTTQTKVLMDVGGRPGKTMSEYVADQHIFMGGGGGGGHQNQNVGTSGTNGGGIVIIRGGVIVGAGGTIRTNGVTVPDTANYDGSGGAGAGGTVLLDVQEVIGNLPIQARGGNGGNCVDEFNFHGTGGGGSGGMVLSTKSLTNVTWDLTGGSAGVHTHPNNPFVGTSNGGTNGAAGSVNTTIKFKTPISLTLTAKGGGEICLGTEVPLEASAGFDKYLWSNGETTRTISVTKNGTYSVTATDAIGCEQTVSGLVVKFNPSQYTLQSEIDYGTVDYRQPYVRSIQFVNTDDENLTIDSITLAPGFAVIQPILPAVVRPSEPLTIQISFFASEERVYNDTLKVYVAKPCPSVHKIAVKGRVNPVIAVASMPDTTAKTGASGFGIPVKLVVTPDTARLESTTLIITVRFDTRVFSVDSVKTGKIIGDVIDLVQNHRTMSIKIEDVLITGGLQIPTWLVGTTMLSSNESTTLEVLDVDWVIVEQKPRTSYQAGILTLEPVCAEDLRAIKFYKHSPLMLAPNPASTEVVLSTVLSAPGQYQLLVRDINGQNVFVHNEHHNSDTDKDLRFVVPVTEWSAGAYVVVFQTPLQTLSQPLMIVR